MWYTINYTLEIILNHKNMAQKYYRPPKPYKMWFNIFPSSRRKKYLFIFINSSFGENILFIFLKHPYEYHTLVKNCLCIHSTHTHIQYIIVCAMQTRTVSQSKSQNWKICQKTTQVTTFFVKWVYIQCTQFCLNSR